MSRFFSEKQYLMNMYFSYIYLQQNIKLRKDIVTHFIEIKNKRRNINSYNYDVRVSGYLMKKTLKYFVKI